MFGSLIDRVISLTSCLLQMSVMNSINWYIYEKSYFKTIQLLIWYFNWYNHQNLGVQTKIFLKLKKN